jgi:hypothetical protein
VADPDPVRGTGYGAAMRFLGGAALVAAVTMMLTGCGSQATPSTASPSVTVAPTTSAPAPVPTATPTPSRTATTPATPEPSVTGTPVSSAPKDQCPDADLGVSIAVADGGGGAGSEFFNILFTNTGGESCALRGTPGVSVVGGGNGEQLGKPADRIQTGGKTVVLASGETVAAPLRIVNIGTDGGPLDGCTVRKGDGYRVYPPHSRKAFFVQDPSAVACAQGPVFMTASPVIRFTD